MTHYKTEMKYLKAVADFITEHGYDVVEPDIKNRDLLDVYGKLANGKKCFIEIHVCNIHIPKPSGNFKGGGIHGIWSLHSDDEDDSCIEVYMGNESQFFGYDSSYLIGAISHQIKPLRKVKGK